MFTKLVINRFLSACEQNADRHAFCISDCYYSYSDLLIRIAEISQAIARIEKDRIGLIANDDIDTYAAIFAIWICGKVYVPLLPEAPTGRNKQIIEQASLVTIFDSTDANITSSLNLQSSFKVITELLSSANFEDQLAYILFTSGSTGIPKGVCISKNNIAHFVDACNELYPDITHEDRCLQMFDLTFDLSIFSFLIPLLSGACVYTIPKNVIKYSHIFLLLEQYNITIALLIPSVLNYVKNYLSEIHLPYLRYSLFCAEALPENLTQQWAKSIPNARIDNLYGPTEATIICSFYTFCRTGSNNIHHGILSIGKPMKGTTLIITDEQGNETMIDQAGELCIGGLQLSPGYINNEHLNNTLFFNKLHNGVFTQFYRSGDFAIKRLNGNIDFVGRKDSQMKIQGFRVELSEIEHHAQKAIDNKANTIALALVRENENIELVLAIESETIDCNIIKEHLIKVLPKYMVPVKYFKLSVFPLNINGKIDKKKIMELISNNGI